MVATLRSSLMMSMVWEFASSARWDCARNAWVIKSITSSNWMKKVI
jgi:hypothetical protein